VATGGFLQTCSSGTELNGNGPWSGSSSGTVIVSFATDGSIQSTGLTSLVAICTGGGSGSSDAGMSGVTDTGAGGGSALMETEPNETLVTANPTNNAAGQLMTVEGQIAPVGDVDWYSFVVSPGNFRTLVATVYSWPGSHTSCMGDPKLFLVDSLGVEIAEDEDDGFVYCPKIDGLGADTGAANLAFGTYYLRIEHTTNTSIVSRYFIDIDLQ